MQASNTYTDTLLTEGLPTKADHAQPNPSPAQPSPQPVPTGMAGMMAWGWLLGGSMQPKQGGGDEQM